MRFIKVTFFLLSQWSGLAAYSAGQDSLKYINDVKAFAMKQIDFDWKGDFYSKWTTDEKPYIYLYISLPDSVKRPPEVTSSFIFIGTDESKATEQALNYNKQGYHAFNYKTYANSFAMLNRRMLSYSKDAIAFIVFHELIHNYLSQKKIKIPYEYNEALCDVIGNYGALEYAKASLNLDIAMVKKQTRRNEKIYESLNSTINQINLNPKKTQALNKKCNDRIHALLKKANLFQKDRFDYKVNNAYLLKNEYYSKNYFLLKKVYLKQGSLKALLKIMETLPDKSSECEAYLRTYM